MRVNVARAELIEKQRGEISNRIQISEIDHHRDVSPFACLDGGLVDFHPGPPKCADLKPTITPAFAFAVPGRRGSIQLGELVLLTGTHSDAYIFSSASTRVRALSITRRLKSGKFRQPDVPASTTVVTPLRNVCAST